MGELVYQPTDDGKELFSESSTELVSLVIQWHKLLYILNIFIGIFDAIIEFIVNLKTK